MLTLENEYCIELPRFILFFAIFLFPLTQSKEKRSNINAKTKYMNSFYLISDSKKGQKYRAR